MPTPIASGAPVSASASPSPGAISKIRSRNSVAATSSARPMPIWMFRRGQPETTPAPNHEPRTAAAIISTSVQMSTLTIAMKMRASTSVGAVWPTLSVPGIRSSRTSPVNLKIAVVGANEPMPSVSKKFVTNPIASPSGVGTGESSPVAPAARPRATARPSATR